MDKTRVLESLRTLQAELADADRLDEQSRAALEQVTAEIQRKLAGEQPVSQHDSETLTGRLQEAVLDFQAEHPQLTGAVNQMAAALANLGI
jgi:hypothetical protein